MFALRVTYLTRRVYAATFESVSSKTEPEWPPHPSRLFSALVAAWGDGGAEVELLPALKWLEEQPAPIIYAGTHTTRRVVQTFVPVNDILMLPDDRPRKPRTFPSASLSQPDVYFVWETEPSAHVVQALEQILRRTCSLGHSASLVSVEIAHRVPERDARAWRPGARRGVPMRIIYPGRLKELREHYQRLQKDPNRIHRPPPGRTTRYGLALNSETAPAQGIFDRMIILRCEAGQRVSLRSTLTIVCALRGALLALAPDPLPEYLSGHAPESTLENPIPSERPHVALVPLPFVNALQATGDLLGVAALIPKTLTQNEREVCWKVLSSIEELRMPWARWTVSLADAEERRRALRPETWTRPATIWSTITPFVFDRYPKFPYGQEARRIAARAFVRIGLPEPCELELHCNPWHVGVPTSALFRPAAARTGKPQRYHCHVWARFERPIAGPVVAGAGRYYGYGLFAPLSERREGR
jgi:CRISPR-associated protein Csb2